MARRKHIEVDKKLLDKIKYAQSGVMLNLLKDEQNKLLELRDRYGIKYNTCSRCSVTWLTLCKRLYPFMMQEKQFKEYYDGN